MYTARVDDKGRLKLPADFQAFFSSFPEKKIFVTSLDGCIGQLYPISVWRQNERFLAESPSLDPEVVANTLFNAQDLGNDAEMDAQGRVSINSQMREELGLAGELHLVVVKGRVEILNETQYQERRRQARPGMDENGKRKALENVRYLEGKGLK